MVNHALAYGTGDLNPGFFAIPPLTSYILFSLYGLMFLIGKVMGAWQGTQDFAVSFFRDPTIFYLVGRFFIGVLPGTASIFLTYKLAERSLTKNAALFAAAVMSFSFLNVVNSHYIYTDMLLTALILLTYERLFFLFKAPNLKNYCLSGLFIGLC
ncbi:MAG TPA: glycosyltransferase family 39 protein, partial [Candidatus Omnitrophota bacterium]|nr:glycosyltransferase family 39 protein [Candidatus Omnitrophota bacterium]